MGVKPAKVKINLGFKMIVDPYEFIGMHVFIEGGYEYDFTYLFRTLLAFGDCVLDIGANIGYFTLLSSRLVGKTGQVHAFEPSSRVMQRLKKNIEINALNNVILHEVAISDRCGNVEFYVASRENLGLSSMRNLGPASAEKTEVRSFSLDSLLVSLPKVKLVKIDVEGAEFLVLKGMKALIERDKPYIILEVTNTFLEEMHSNVAMVHKVLKEHQYVVYKLNNGRIEEFSSPSVDQFHMLAFHQSADLPNSIKALKTGVDDYRRI
jgi:FkbM family methyltransferase